MVDDTGLEPVTSRTSTPSLCFFLIFFRLFIAVLLQTDYFSTSAAERQILSCSRFSIVNYIQCGQFPHGQGDDNYRAYPPLEADNILQAFYLGQQVRQWFCDHVPVEF